MKNDTMQAWQLHRFGLDGLNSGPVPIPVPGPREVLIRVSAAALNFRDKAIIDGIYNPDILFSPTVLKRFRNHPSSDDHS